MLDKILRSFFAKTDRDDDFLKNYLSDEKNSSGFNFCSMGKTKKVVILPLVSKTAGKKNIHNSWGKFSSNLGKKNTEVI